MALEIKYFVLKLRAKTLTDLYAVALQEAMLKYADIIESVDKELAKTLRDWADNECIQQNRMRL